MNEFNEQLYKDYTPSKESTRKALLLTSKLAKLSIRMKDVFLDDYRGPSRIFAFIESKYSSKIEGIYTTLFDVVNTGKETDQQKIIKPLVEALFSGDKIINETVVNQIEKQLNADKDRSKRWLPEFGIYEGDNKIYEPPLEEKYVKKALKKFYETANEYNDVHNATLLHLMFEKLHPFVDGNGRIGRMIMNRMLVRITNYGDVLPLSWSIFKNKQKYYEAFNFNTNEELDKSLMVLMDILLHMYDVTKQFLIKLKEYLDMNIAFVMTSSTRMTERLARSILLNLQTKNSVLTKGYGLNSRTAKRVFEKISEKLDFNEKNIGREKVYWNIELESLIEAFYNG